MQLGPWRITEPRTYGTMGLTVLAGAFWMCLSTTCAYAQGSVKLLNITNPMTSIEASDTARIQITGAAPNSQVKFSCTSPPGQGACGTDPTIHTLEGMTDSSGNFTKDYPMTPGYVGNYEEHWYVNVNGSDIEVIASNPDSTYIGHSPRLPTFSVFSQFSGTNCSSPAIDFSTCGHSSVPHQWIWSPVTYTSDSSAISTTDVAAAVQSWTSIEDRVPMSNDTSGRRDILVTDEPNLGTGVLGLTDTYGEDCNLNCNGHLMFTCPNGACLNANVVYYVIIYLNPGEISNTATNYSNYVFATPAMVANMTLRHELGHGLRLRHAYLTNGICSEVKDIMYESSSVVFGCGVTAPNASCDTGAINSVYPSPVANCGTGPLYCDVSTRCQ